MSERIISSSRSGTRPRSSTITSEQNRTLLDIRAIPPPIQPTVISVDDYVFFSFLYETNRVRNGLLNNINKNVNEWRWYLVNKTLLNQWINQLVQQHTPCQWQQTIKKTLIHHRITEIHRRLFQDFFPYYQIMHPLILSLVMNHRYWIHWHQSIGYRHLWDFIFFKKKVFIFFSFRRGHPVWKNHPSELFILFEQDNHPGNVC